METFVTLVGVTVIIIGISLWTKHVYKEGKKDGQQEEISAFIEAVKIQLYPLERWYSKDETTGKSKIVMSKETFRYILLYINAIQQSKQILPEKYYNALVSGLILWPGTDEVVGVYFDTSRAWIKQIYFQMTKLSFDITDIKSIEICKHSYARISNKIEFECKECHKPTQIYTI